VLVGAVVLWKYLPPMQGTLAQRMVIASLPQHPVPLAWDEPGPRPLASDEAGARSLASERWLAAQPAEPVIVRVGTRAEVTHLEDRIAWVDDKAARRSARARCNTSAIGSLTLWHRCAMRKPWRPPCRDGTYLIRR
jgi:hypothetical protein